ncbi:isocitrate lyase/phosphoenolpyruvate mutase family protein, partial [Amycolatopsis sp. H6(2020)]|nr:isocitrate lyase/phosphoenolpyruvate mutase family protein [Amycolatopsis sp. H6(2020)]
AAAAQARRDENFLIMARTDLRGVEGLEAAIARMRRLVEAGADAIFPEAMTSLEEFEMVRAAVDVPILANMTEFGRSQLYTKDELAAAGVNLIIYPVTLLRASLGAMERVLETIAAEGTQEAAVDQMLTR